ncbi:MAG: cell wall-binding repeat-containing protein, partial [Clostridia bacterium]|nr:cell wall-binding repeat-containing protein [Clostridia bacterium]
NGVLYVGNYLVDTNIFYVNGSYKIKAGTKYITHAAFSSCYGLTEVIIPGSVVEIGVGGFQYCDFLENVTISNGVKSIGGSAFEGCPRLTSITIPDSVTSIDDNAFDYCDSLESIIIPESVTYIGEDVFQESNNVTIYGYRGSAAQRYAETNNIPFVSLDVITRVAGGSRVDTSLEVASRGWTRANTVILTNGYNFADALAGGPLSYALNAPILLTANKEILEQSVINKINALGATKVIILGGTAAVNSTIEQTLSARYNVERVYGASRFDTAVAIAEKLAQVSGRYSASAFVAYGYNYPDALAVSSAAAISGTPILFAKADGSFTESTANYISGHRIRNATILGGTGAVGAEAEYNLARLGAANVERVFGASRYDTAFAIVRKYANLFTGNDIVLATGASFPDALAGGAFAAKIKAPVILVHPKQIADGALEYIAAKDPETVYVLGGTGAVADSTAAKFISLLD